MLLLLLPTLQGQSLFFMEGVGRDPVRVLRVPGFPIGRPPERHVGGSGTERDGGYHVRECRTKGTRRGERGLVGVCSWPEGSSGQIVAAPVLFRQLLVSELPMD